MGDTVCLVLILLLYDVLKVENWPLTDSANLVAAVSVTLPEWMLATARCTYDLRVATFLKTQQNLTPCPLLNGSSTLNASPTIRWAEFGLNAIVAAKENSAMPSYPTLHR